MVGPRKIPVMVVVVPWVMASVMLVIGLVVPFKSSA
jgi:hypothetical protein